MYLGNQRRSVLFYNHYRCVVLLSLLFCVLLIVMSFVFDLKQAQNIITTVSSSAFKKFINLPQLIEFCNTKPSLLCVGYLRDNKTDYSTQMSANESTHFFRRYCVSDESKLSFHMFWNGALTQSLILALRSYLFTQNLQCSRMILWNEGGKSYKSELSKTNFSGSSLLERYRNVISVKTFNLSYEISLTNIHLKKYHNTTLEISRFLSNANSVEFSDAVRFILLYNYGGIYLDADVLLLRDFQILYQYEFAYKWEHLRSINTAVLRLFPQSYLGGMIHRGAAQQRNASNIYQFYHPHSIAQYLFQHNFSFSILPCAFFDPLWLPVEGDNVSNTIWRVLELGGFDMTFRAHGNTVITMDYFSGAFAYHWHNRYNLVAQNGSFFHSWMDYLAKAIPWQSVHLGHDRGWGRTDIII